MVGIIMGSDSDLPIMQEAIDILERFDIEIEVDIVSAHRTPEKLFDYSKNAGILAAQIIGSSDTCVLDKITAYKEGLKIKVTQASDRVKK